LRQRGQDGASAAQALEIMVVLPAHAPVNQQSVIDAVGGLTV
jgi:hypothetical protein